MIAIKKSIVQFASNRSVAYFGPPILFYLAIKAMHYLSYWFVSPFIPSSRAGWKSWDAAHYLAIAESGYTFGLNFHSTGNTIAFFPAFPFLLATVDNVLNNPILSGLAVSFLAGFVCTIVLFDYVAREYGENAGLMTIALFFSYPYSIFLSAPYTESLFAATLVTALWGLKYNRPLVGSFAAGLAFVTRITGLLLFAIVIYDVFRRRHAVGAFKRSFVMVSLAGGFIGLFLTYQHLEFNNPFAFLDAQRVGWSHIAPAPLFSWALFPDLFLSHAKWQLDITLTVILAVSLWPARRFVDRYCLAFGIGLLALSTSTSSPVSLGRYGMMCIPAFIYGGIILSQVNVHLRYLILMVMSGFSMVLAYGFFMHAWVI